MLPEARIVRGKPALLYSTIEKFVDVNVTHVTSISVGSPESPKSENGQNEQKIKSWKGTHTLGDPGADS